MNDELETSEFKPGKIGGGQVHMVPTGHMKPIEPMKPIPKVTRTVHKAVEKLVNPASSLKITSGLGTQVQNNGNEIILATQALPLDVWQAVAEVPKAGESEIIGRFDDPLVLTAGYAASASDQWHLWTTSAGSKTEDKLGVEIQIEERKLTFDSTGVLVKVTAKDPSIASARAKMHPWQCYITSSQPDSVKLKINEYSCLMKGQSAWPWFSHLTWADRIVPDDFYTEWTHTDPLDVIYLEVSFDATSRMKIGATNHPEIISPNRWSGFPNYQSVQGIFIENPSTPFTWRQLLAYWELTSGDMVPDAVFNGSQYTLRCPTTTHLKESIARGFYDGDYTNIVDFCCLEPWFGCFLGS